MQTPPNPHSDLPSADVKAGSVPTLSGLFAGWWRARWQLFRWIGSGAVVAWAILAAVYFLRPVRQEARLEFQLLFSGADREFYPNGNRFTPADIVAEPVLEKVHRTHKLDEVVPFEIFRNAFAVLPRNTALAEFRREFRGRLEDTNLNQVERTKLEDEYADRLRAMRTGQFIIVGRLPDGWPEALSPAILGDILTTWAEVARVQGVFRYDLDVYSPNILANNAPYQEDYLLLLDRIRLAIDRTLGNLTQLDGIPGAALLRAGPRQVSLGELKVRLRDDFKYRLSLLEVPVYGLGLYRNRAFSEAYINEQLIRLRREVEHARAMGRTYDEALKVYAGSAPVFRPSAGSGGQGGTGAFGGGALIPQLGDTFLSRVLDMASMQDDIGFRQQLSTQLQDAGSKVADLESETRTYENILQQLQRQDASMEGRRATMQEWVSRQADSQLRALADTLAEAQLIYLEISRRSLEPEQIFEHAKPPRLGRVSSVGLGRLAFSLILLGGIYAGAVLVWVGTRQLRAR